MEKPRGMLGELNIGEVALISADEDYIDDAFIQKLTFNIEIK